nr:helix-turn-helix transcriptional regulator [uncultured Aminipila sp.]
MKLDKERFEIALANQNLLVQELCDNAGITRASLNLALKGKRTPRPQTIGKIARALNVPVEQIIKQEVSVDECTGR